MRAWVIALGLGLAALSGVSASGQQTTTATTTAAPEASRRIPAGTYRLDPRHASVLFRIQHEGLAWFTARFDTKDATLDLNPTDMSQTHLTASVDASSVNTGLTSNSGERTLTARSATPWVLEPRRRSPSPQPLSNPPAPPQRA